MGLDLFGSFWGNAKKNKPHLRMIHESPTLYKPAHYHPAQPTPHITNHHNRPTTTNPSLTLSPSNTHIR
ncbi:MAG: hypothetical protein AVDCRST_MAG56-6045 [uncultured Cytophagales bacterium]|uniref:Uncharacterized protein n=1 Tax=uncultured Cytophagales bacterium TaxID=158755 RepID=A0A6J4KKA6_9SPHI|nr:MAG: hypothetical protein AVDCRST_MAG56-6045 [uncultured Cytophagales bacterium]